MTSSQTEKWGNVKNMFALIIGIDDYLHVPKLKGAVADSKRFKSFLINDVKVQKDRIITLRNSEATREGIVDAFRALWECDSIQRDDPILIFYAGHGCEMPTPKGWEVGDHKKIQAICPCDMKREDASSKAVYPIPDRTIGAWLNLLSYKKGHNITIILDCCHSAGATRNPEQGARYLEFDGEFPYALEEEFSDALKIAGGVPMSYVNQHSRSHVLLAACSAKETAKEVDGKGLFTTELLRALKEEKEVDQLSFLEFTRRLRSLTKKDKILQTPQCYGHFKDRVIFSSLLKLGLETFPVSWDPETKHYRIEAGVIQGVDTGSLFDMYETATVGAMTSKPLCTLTARTVYPLHAFAVINEADVQLSEVPRVVRHVCCGIPLKVHFTSALLAMVDQDKVSRLRDFHRKVKVEPDSASADFTVDIDDKGEKAIFIANLEDVTGHGSIQLPSPVRADAENINRVLLAAARWKHYLRVSCDSPLAKNIKVQFLLLEKNHDTIPPIMQPKRKLLNGENDIVHIDIKGSYSKYYGMRIKNNTEKDLHFSMMAFDIGDLKITSYVSGSVGVQSKGSADTALYSKESLPIGYGNGGRPLSFEPSGEIDVTFFKMYFTANPMDFKWLEQGKPFATFRGDRGLLRNEAAWKKLNTSTTPIEFTKLFTVVQHAHSQR